MNRYEYADLHCHILPGVDDGAKDLETTYQMLRMAANEGTREMVVTPHNKVNRHSAGKETIERLVSELQHWLDQEEIPLKLYTGNEIMYRHGIDSLLKEQRCCTLAGSFYTLIEFMPQESITSIINAVRSITMAGYTPVIAHVERYDVLVEENDYLDELIEMGALLQVNASTITGNLGIIMKYKVIKWIKKGQIHVVASDAHGTHKRIPGLAKSAAIIEKKCGKQIARQLYETNPHCIIANTLINGSLQLEENA